MHTLKIVFLLILAFMLFRLTGMMRYQKTFHYFLTVVLVVFVIYQAFYRGMYYPNILLEVFVATIIGFVLAFTYKPKKRRVMPPMKPIERPVPPVKKETKKSVATKVAPKRKAKKVTKKSAKKITKKTAKKVTTKKVTAKKAPKRTTKKAAKKSAKKASKKTAKKVTKKVAKKTVKKVASKKTKSSRSKAMDAKLIACNQEHELGTVLSHFNKKNTIENRKALQNLCKHFKDLKTYKPHNRVNFYRYLETSTAFKKLR